MKVIQPACGIAIRQPTQDARHSRSPRDSERIGTRMSVSRKLTSRCCTRSSGGGSMRAWNGQVSSDRGDAGGGDHDGRVPPAQRIDQRRDGDAADDAAERHAGLFDGKHQIAMRRAA